jgi:hypothetical protein
MAALPKLSEANITRLCDTLWNSVNMHIGRNTDLRLKPYFNEQVRLRLDSDEFAISSLYGEDNDIKIQTLTVAMSELMQHLPSHIKQLVSNNTTVPIAPALPSTVSNSRQDYAASAAPLPIRHQEKVASDQSHRNRDIEERQLQLAIKQSMTKQPSENPLKETALESIKEFLDSSSLEKIYEHVLVNNQCDSCDSFIKEIAVTYDWLIKNKSKPSYNANFKHFKEICLAFLSCSCKMDMRIKYLKYKMKYLQLKKIFI